MNITEATVRLGERIQIPFHRGIIILRIQSTNEVDTDIEEMRYYSTAQSFTFTNRDPSVESNDIAIRYYDYAHQDYMNLQKLYFDLVSKLQFASTHDQEAWNLMVYLIIFICQKMRKCQEAIDFVHRAEKGQQHILYLILSTQFDSNLRTKDACYCFLKALQCYQNSDCDVIKQQIGQLMNMPNNNSYFDLNVLILRYKKQLIQILNQLQREQVTSLFSDSKDICVINFLQLLLNNDFYSTLMQNDDICLNIIQNYVLNSQYIQNKTIQQETAQLMQIIFNQVQYLQLNKQVQILEFILSRHLNQGVYNQLFQMLVQSISTGMKNTSKDVQTQFFQQYKKSQLRQLFSNLCQRLTFYIQNLRIHNGLEMCVYIIQLISVLGIKQKYFLNQLVNNFWSQNEYMLENYRDSQVQVAIRYNRYFADDILVYQFLLINYMEYQSAENANPQVLDILSQFYRSLFKSFNLRSKEIIQFGQERLEKEVGLNLGQIFYTANSIYSFAAVYCKNVVIEYFEEFYFEQVTKFYASYSGSEALLCQVHTAVDNYITIIEESKKDISTQLVLQLFENVSKWTEFQIYPVFFQLLSLLCHVIQENIGKYHSQHKEIWRMLVRVVNKLSINTLVDYDCLKTIIQLIIQVQEECQDSSPFSEVVATIKENYLKTDMQFVSQFINIYLNQVLHSQKLTCTEGQIHSVVNDTKDLFRHFSQIFFGLQQYVYSAQYIGDIIIFALTVNKGCQKLDVVGTFTDFFEVISKQAPAQFFGQLVDYMAANVEVLCQFSQQLDFLYLVNLIAELGGSQEMNRKVQGFFGVLEGNRAVLQHASTPSCGTRSLSASRPASAGQLLGDSSARGAYLSVDQLGDLPPFSDSVGLRRAVGVPGVPFTYVVPHPEAREARTKVEVDELIADIGGVEQLDEGVVEGFVGPCEPRPRSGHGRVERPESCAPRPTSAGHAQGDGGQQEPLQTPKHKAKVVLLRAAGVAEEDAFHADIGPTARPRRPVSNYILDDDWGEEGVEEEDLLDKVDRELGV